MAPGWSYLWCIPAVIVAITPLIYLWVRTSELGWETIDGLLRRPRLLEMVGNTLILAATVTVGVLVIGITTAFLVSRTDIRFRALIHILAALPLAAPTYVTAFAWRTTFTGFEGFWPTAIVLTLATFPYVHLPVTAALSRTDPALEDMSRSLGRGPWTTFFAVTIRQIAPAAIAGGLLASLYVLSDFGAVSILKYETFTTAIYSSHRLGFAQDGALLYSSVLALIALAVLASEWGVSSRGRNVRRTRADGGAVRTARRIRLGWRQVPIWIGIGALTWASLGVMAWSLLKWNIVGVSQAGTAELWSAAATSLGLAAVATVATMLLIVPVGLYVARHRGPLAAVTERLMYIGHALPGIVVGLSLVFMAINVTWLQENMYQTTAWLIVGYAVIFLPLGLGAVKAAAEQAPPRLGEVARSLGRRPSEVFRTVTLPLTAPGIAAGAALVFLTAMKELPATLLLRPAHIDTLATRLWTYTDVSAFSAAAPFAALLVLLSAIPTWLLASRFGRN
ncbi:iron ABC transporter permease [Natronoglycomyces albus]|uniref:ABC transporter permease n=1 Tax=Natronoglycomyces albus TaxID=2811108 RepID=UPI0031B5C1B3